jgi:hypothetical protein
VSCRVVSNHKMDTRVAPGLVPKSEFPTKPMPRNKGGVFSLGKQPRRCGKKG